jgi:hypothetical protein
MGKRSMLAWFWLGNLKEGDPSEDLGVDDRIVLNGCQMRRMVEIGLNWFDRKQELMAGYYEHGNLAAGSM